MTKSRDPVSSDISAEELISITGLTDRRHRQLAKQGFFPPPFMGRYQLIPTLTGLLRYFQQQLSKKNNKAAKEDLKYKVARRKKAERETLILENRTVPKAELAPALRSLAIGFRSVVQLALETEMPAGVEAMSESERKDWGARKVDDIFQRFNEGLELWMEPKPDNS